MSSAKRRLVKKSPSEFTPLFSQVNLLNNTYMCINHIYTYYYQSSSEVCIPLTILCAPVLPSTAWEMWYPLSYSSLDPDFLILFAPMYCFWAARIYAFQDVYVHLFYSLFCNAVNIACVCTESSAFSISTNATQNGMLYARHFSFLAIAGNSLVALSGISAAWNIASKHVHSILLSSNYSCIRW